MIPTSTSRTHQPDSPRSSLSHALFVKLSGFIYGAGYSSATDDYKVFAASCDVDGDEEPEPMKMFSLKAHVWKAIQHPGHQSSVMGVLLNEALHWVSGNEIFAFDLAQEEFIRTMRLPHNVQTPQRHYSVHRFPYLGICEGCLALCMSSSGEYSVNFWVMRQYGVYDSWTKFYSPADHLGLYLRFLVTERCTIAVKDGGSATRLLLVKIDPDQETELDMYMDYGFDMIPHEESLLWISDG
ncbi:hypothetical protein ACLB2K_032367 [Fragaria x ananassa]